MGKTFDTRLFIDIILSEGARFLYSSNKFDTDIESYTGRNGNERVQICVADEETSITTLKIHLYQLGMSELIPALFN